MDAKLDASALKGLIQRLEQSPKVLSAAKRQAFQAAAPRLKSALDAQIGGSGRVQGWQGAYVGSEGGYAAVRPLKETYIKTKGKQTGFRAGPKEYAVGYVTNAINNGHRTPRNKMGYRTSARVIAGRQFYQRAQPQAEQAAQEAAQQVLSALKNHLEG